MKKFTTFLLGFLVCLNISLACINDGASMHFEKQRFPMEDDLIAGKFHIHSKDFHEWRIKDRLNKLEKDPNNPALLDDLSVSYEKTGQTQLAIDTLQGVLHKYPNRYETLANLGTFYIHHQEYQQGLDLLKKAIKINPQAHYGREIYQIKVVEYILSLNKKPPFVFPIQTGNKNFATFLLKDIKPSEQEDELIRAIVGVSGMLKFGNSDSPILLEVLGDLYFELYKEHTWPQGFGNQLEDYATKFYIAANLKSGKNIENPNDSYNIIANFLQSKRIIAHISDGYSSKMERVKEAILSGNEYKEKIFIKERESIKNSKNPEQHIYSTLFDKPREQKDLFSEKKKQVQTAYNYSKKVMVGTFIDIIMLFLAPILIIISICLFIFFLPYSLLALNVLYFKNRNANISKSHKFLFLFGMLLFNLSLPIIIIFFPNFGFNISILFFPYFGLDRSIILLTLYLIYLIVFNKTKIDINSLNNPKFFRSFMRFYKFCFWVFVISYCILIPYFYLPGLLGLEPSMTNLKF